MAITGKLKNLLANPASFCDRLAAAREGAVAITFALSFIPLLIAVGVSIDMSRAYIVKQRLINTSDSAGLAIGSSIDDETTTAEIESILANFFAANFPSGELGTVTSTTYTYDGTTITITAAALVETTFMKIANINNLTVNATSVITRQEDNLEVVLVLDNTGSMASSGKIDDLKDAADSLVDILFGTDATSSQVKIGLVPFAATVNIGTSNTDYISDSSGWDGCVKALDSPDDEADDSTGTWDPYDGAGGFYGTGCPEAITPLTNVKATLTTAIAAMDTTGYTHINYGSVWGWRVISSSEPFTEGATYGAADTTKAMIILTDGNNTFSDKYSAYKDYNSGEPSSSDLDDKLETVCTSIKALDIIIYTITFDLSDADTQTLFENCATDADKYYDSPTGPELTRVFRAIAAELKQLHVSS